MRTPSACTGSEGAAAAPVVEPNDLRHARPDRDAPGQLGPESGVGRASELGGVGEVWRRP